MSFKNIFWNPQEHRIRALCRLFLQFVFMFVISTLLSIPLVLAMRISPQQLSISPQSPNFTLFMIFNSLITLVSITLSIWVAGKWFDRRAFRDFGLHFSPRFFGDFFFGIVLGAVLMSAIFLIELSTGWITISDTMHSSYPDQSFQVGLLQTVVLFLCVGIYEELSSRGYLLRNLAEGLNFPFIGNRWALIIAWVLSSVVFGILHAANPNASLISTISITLAGLFLGLGYVLTGELAIPIGIHITWNFFQGNVFGFPVSGTTPIATFIAIKQGGPVLITGGAFGPEAGLIGLGAICLGSVLTILWVKSRYQNANLKINLAQYSIPKKKELMDETIAVGE